MSATAHTLTRHELVGLAVTVTDARNPDLVGIDGTVIHESEHTLRVRPGEPPLGDPAERARQVPKHGTAFVFTLADGTTVEVAGERLVARPARRTEQRGDSPWV